MFSKKKIINEDVRFGNFRKELEWSERAEFFKLPDEKKKEQVDTAKDVLTADVLTKVIKAIKQEDVVKNKQEDGTKSILITAILKAIIETYKKITVPIVIDIFTKPIGDEIECLYKNYGWKDVVYVSKRSQLSPGLARTATELSPRIFLASEQCSMPVSDFILAYKGGWCTPPEVLQEWSGMTKEEQATAYDEVVKLVFRRALEKVYKELQSESQVFLMSS